jgi:hypothetical protein
MYIQGFATQRGFTMIGWVGPEMDYSRGAIDRELLRAIKWALRMRRVQLRHREDCVLCQPPRQVTVHVGVRKLYLGSGELYFRRRQEGYYRCSDLVYHYIKDHCYMPPAEFVEDAKADFISHHSIWDYLRTNNPKIESLVEGG